jgi:hypothetical protein
MDLKLAGKTAVTGCLNPRVDGAACAGSAPIYGHQIEQVARARLLVESLHLPAAPLPLSGPSGGEQQPGILATCRPGGSATGDDR